MTTITNKVKELPIAYVLDEEALKRLEELILGEGFQTRWYASLSDGSSLGFSALSDLIALPNTQERKITRVRCRGTDPVANNEVDITFKNYGMPVGSVNYELTGDDRTVVYVSDKLEEFLLGQRQWYTVLRTSWLGTLIQNIFFVFLTSLVLAKHGFHLVRFSPPYIEMLPLAALWAVLYFIYQGVLKVFYPASIFAIGKGIERHKSLVKMRELLIGGLVIAVVGAVIGGLIIG